MSGFRLILWSHSFWVGRRKDSCLEKMEESSPSQLGNVCVLPLILALVFTNTSALAQFMVGFSILSQSIPKITFSCPMFVTRNGSLFCLFPIVVSKMTIVSIFPAVFPELSMLYSGIGEGREIVFILFSFTKLKCTKEEEALESIIARVDIFESSWNMRGIFRCCPFAPKIITEKDKERENEVVEIIEEKQFERKGSA
jgi:hypothetical protein